MRMAYDESGNRVRDVSYIYDAMNRLERVKNDDKNLNMDEFFAYDAQGRIVQQLRGSNASEPASKSDAGKYAYIENTNMLKSVSDGMGESADKRSMADGENFEYDRDGNLTADHSKYMTIAYDWRGMPVEFKRLDKCYDIHEQIICDSVKLDIVYDGSGRRISKTSLRKNVNSDDWTLEQITHYTGIGSEIRKEYHNGELQSTKVVVNMPQGLGRYGIENADGMAKGDEFYLKNHLGSTMMVAQVSSTNASEPAKVAAAYDYRAFGEQVTLKKSADKVTENFTGKELDDETLLSYHGARYLDPMLGVWISVDPKRFFSSPYLYMGNGYNPILFFDLNGMKPGDPFGSPQEAAIDFAKLYNGVSIATSTEYGTIIYRKGNSFSYVTPSLGTSRTVDLDECVLDVAENAELQLITSAHTHGSYSGFRSLEPSSLDFSSEFIPTDINLYPYYKENMNEPAYVAVPNGTLIEYRSDGSQRVVPAGGLAADPQSRWGDVDKQYHADLGLLE